MPETKVTLAAKMVLIMSEIGQPQPTGTMQKKNKRTDTTVDLKVFSEADLIVPFQKALVKHGVAIWPKTIACSREGETIEALVEYTFEDVETMEQRVVQAAGAADVSDGKTAASMAQTDARKNMIRNLLQIASQKGPQRSQPPTKPATPPPAREKVDPVTNIGKWNTTFSEESDGTGVLRCFVLSVNDGRPGRKSGTATLEVRHMKRDGSDEVGTNTEFLDINGKTYEMVKATPLHNATFKLKKTQSGQRTYWNIVDVIGAEEPKGVK